MIVAEIKTDCCGCNACVQICPRQCICMKKDNEGFEYPHINKDNCIHCNLCEKVCPIIHPYREQSSLKVFAAKNENEQIRLKSSSGGIFSLLAERVLEQQGVVFGACFDDNWCAKHSYTETQKGLEPFRGSKYMQSYIGHSYIDAERFLKKGRQVLFVGSPCQVAGLKRYLRRDYDNLLTVDFLCHGVPSPKIWNLYLDDMLSKQDASRKEIVNIEFRSKSTGWRKYSVLVELARLKDGGSYVTSSSSFFSKDLFMQVFLSDLTLRPSCYDCRFKWGKSGSDITIGDYWSIHSVLPWFDDDKGVSIVLVNTTKGNLYYPLDKSVYVETPINKLMRPRIVSGNAGFKEKLEIPFGRKAFFADIDKGESVTDVMTKYAHLRMSHRVRAYNFLKRIVKKIIVK